MGRYTSTVTQKGQVTIPAEMRRMLKIGPKDRVEFEVSDGEIRLRPAKSVIAELYGSVKPMNRPEDFEKMRREVEEEMAEACLKEM